MKIKVNEEKDLQKVVKELLKRIKSCKNDSAILVKLHGDLGSGKTTFVKKLAKTLNITKEIISPTFVISKNYRIPKNDFVEQEQLIHVDAYRLNSSSQSAFIGLDKQLMDKKNLILIEWPDVFGNLKKDAIEIFFEYDGENRRLIDIK